MFNIHTSMTSANEEIERLTALNASLVKRNDELELLVILTENQKQEIEYLKNKIVCANQIEKALREQLEETELKAKAYQNSSKLVQDYHEKNQKHQKSAIGFDYSTLGNKKACAPSVTDKIVNVDAPHILR
ncbi:hypothetical protein ACR2XN_28825, partial [Klebsiella pneumoniae]